MIGTLVATGLGLGWVVGWVVLRWRQRRARRLAAEQTFELLGAVTMLATLATLVERPDTIERFFSGASELLRSTLDEVRGE